jgi:ssDNA-binding Zn-finger/Zn-ribbon topoisomerase 1
MPRLVLAVVTVLLLPALPLHWLACRLTAARCPDCGSGWRTELVGEWGRHEFWHCHRCGHGWHVRA